jgi:hypothetical protein
MQSRRSGGSTPIPPIASTHDPFPASQKRTTGGGPTYARPPLRLRVSPSCVNAAHIMDVACADCSHGRAVVQTSFPLHAVATVCGL